MLKVAILNNFLGTFGGGERVCYGVASTLASLGYSVDVLTFEDKPPTTWQIEEAFGPGHSGFRVVSLAGVSGKSQDAVLTERLKDYAIFINNTAGSSFENACPLGIYMVMFPFQGPGPFLNTYHLFVCNSEYTAFYTRHLWRRDLEISVLYPYAAPVEGFEPARERTKEIVTVGRFNVHGHNKNQAVLVDAFKRALPLMPAGWQLTLMGRVNPGPETAEYVRNMVEGCRGLPIRFEFEASEERKLATLHRAAMYWSGTGIGLSEPQDAAKMEHFGISIVEGMMAGAIPLCYGRGGPREIVQHGVDGFLYGDLEELITYSALVAQRPSVRQRMGEAALRRAQDFSRARFDRELTRLFKAVVAA